MDLALFSSLGIEFLLRWGHFLAGVTWIGLLYYFNFVQGEWFKEIDAQVKSIAIQKLVPRALWWFRWAAMFTFLTGLAILSLRGHLGGLEMFNSSWGVFILSGSLLGLLMFLNVWLIIWPNQKIVIASAEQVGRGGQALAEAPAALAKAGLASRTNVMFSVPMLFFMGAASHLGIATSADYSIWPTLGAVSAVALLLEANAIKGKMGPLTTVSGVISCGVGLAAVLYGLIEYLA